MSKISKHLKTSSSHSRQGFKFDAHTVLQQVQKCSGKIPQQKSDSQIPALKAVAGRVAEDRSFQRTSLSPVGGEGRRGKRTAIPALLKGERNRDNRDALTPDSKSPCSPPHVSSPSLYSWELGDIEIRLNERLILANQTSDNTTKYLACRDALRELIQGNPANSSVLVKIEKGIEEWVECQETLIRRKGRSGSIESEDCQDEVSKLREKVAFLTRENLRMTRQLAEMASSIPQSHVADLIVSLQEEVSIHRKREDLLMSIITKMREKGYLIGEMQKCPRSERTTGEESTKNSARDCGWEDGENREQGEISAGNCCEIKVFEMDASSLSPPDVPHKGVTLRLTKPHISPPNNNPISYPGLYRSLSPPSPSSLRC